MLIKLCILGQVLPYGHTRFLSRKKGDIKKLVISTQGADARPELAQVLDMQALATCFGHPATRKLSRAYGISVLPWSHACRLSKMCLFQGMAQLLADFNVSAYVSGHLHAAFGERLHRLHPTPAGEMQLGTMHNMKHRVCCSRFGSEVTPCRTEVIAGCISVGLLFQVELTRVYVKPCAASTLEGK